jgi:hypothetical protein
MITTFELYPEARLLSHCNLTSIFAAMELTRTVTQKKEEFSVEILLFYCLFQRDVHDRFVS